MAIGSRTPMRATGLVIGILVALTAAIWQLPARAITSAADGSAAAVSSGATAGQKPDALSAPAQSALDQVLGAGHCLVTASATYGAASSRHTTTYDPKHVAVLKQSRASSPGYRATVIDNG